jgi:hypothetical protein
MNKTIPLKAVQDALMCARVRANEVSIDGRPMARFAAFSQYPDLNITCREALRGYARHPHLPMSFGAMSQGDLDLVLARVRSRAGLAEVRRIWGQGLRDLKAEFTSTVMR